MMDAEWIHLRDELAIFHLDNPMSDFRPDF